MKPFLEDDDLDPTSIDLELPPGNSRHASPRGSAPDARRRGSHSRSTPYGSVIAPGLGALAPVGPRADPVTGPTVMATTEQLEAEAAYAGLQQDFREPRAVADMSGLADFGEETSEEILVHASQAEEIPVYDNKAQAEETVELPQQWVTPMNVVPQPLSQPNPSQWATQPPTDGAAWPSPPPRDPRRSLSRGMPVRAAPRPTPSEPRRATPRSQPARTRKASSAITAPWVLLFGMGVAVWFVVGAIVLLVL